MKLDDVALEAAAKVEHAAWRETSQQFRSDPEPLPKWHECDVGLRQLFIVRVQAAITAYFKALEADGLAYKFAGAPVTTIRQRPQSEKEQLS